MELFPVPFVPTCPTKWVYKAVEEFESSGNLILQAPPNLHPFVLEGLVRTKTFFTLLLGVAYSVSKSESSSSSEVRNYDQHRFIPKLLLRCGSSAWTRFQLILKKVGALSGL